MRKLLRHLAVTAISFVVVASFVIITLNISFLNPIATAFDDFYITDIYYQMFDTTSEPRTSKIITIVDMTELKSRREIAMTIHQIENLAPKVLGLDMVFEGRKEDTIGDSMIVDAVSMYNNLVTSYTLQKYKHGQYNEEVHSFFVPNIHMREGFTNFERKLYGGIKREVSIGQKTKHELKASFALVASNLYAGESVMDIEDRQLSINYIPTNFNEISYKEICNHPELIEDHLVLLGATKEEYDMHYTPLGRMSGVELLAYSIETMLLQKEIKNASLWQTIIISFIIVFLTELVQVRYKNFISRRNNRFVRFFGTTELSLNFLTFILMFFWLTFFFILFNYCHYNTNLLWAFSGMVFLDSSRQFYDSLINSLRHEKKNTD